MRQVNVMYFVSRGSKVFMAPLDARNDFDQVNHIKEFLLNCMIVVYRSALFNLLTGIRKHRLCLC